MSDTKDKIKNSVEEKKCSACKEVLEISNFTKRKDKKSECWMSRCKKCRASRKRELYRLKKEKEKKEKEIIISC